MPTATNNFFGTGDRKTSFAMTCNRLSMFLKEKNSLRDFGINSTFDIKGKPEISSPVIETNMTTIDLLSNMELPVDTNEKSEKPVNVLPQYVSLHSFCKPDNSTNKTVSGEVVGATECKTAKMTIMYKGQVLVFDNVSADKARDMMLAAGGASSDNKIQNQIQSASTPNSRYEGLGSQDRIVRGLEVNGLDLPIARRSSLHKFLAKRRERATETTPYRLPNRLMATPTLHNKFDLNL